jgi:hypothetical protein
MKIRKTMLALFTITTAFSSAVSGEILGGTLRIAEIDISGRSVYIKGKYNDYNKCGLLIDWGDTTVTEAILEPTNGSDVEQSFDHVYKDDLDFKIALKGLKKGNIFSQINPCQVKEVFGFEDKKISLGNNEFAINLWARKQKAQWQMRMMEEKRLADLEKRRVESQKLAQIETDKRARIYKFIRAESDRNLCRLVSSSSQISSDNKFL